MATFVFETLSAAEAAAFSAAADLLTFQTAGFTGSMATVLYLPASEISVNVADRTVTFGAGLAGETATFANGGVLYVGATSAEAVTGTASSDGMYGGEGADTLTGGAGDDVLQGNQGADVLNGGDGADVIYGGQDDDVINVGAGVTVRAQGNRGNDTVSAPADAGQSTLLGGQGNDQIVGGGAADFLNGNLGDDAIAGGGGDDMLLGEGGADTMDGGAGADLFIVTAGTSEVTLAGSDRIVGWSAEDRVDVPGAGGEAAFYVIPAGGGGMDPYGYDYPTEPGPLTFSTALSRANQWMPLHPDDDVNVAQIPEGVIVLLDSNDDNAVDLSILLVGAGLSTVTVVNFI